jgi:hypothetical protein
MTVVNIDINELAAEVTRKIRDEINKIKIVDFGEVKTTTSVTKGWKATVLMAGASTPTVPLQCMGSYTPTVGDWVILVYPKNSTPIIVGKCPV